MIYQFDVARYARSCAARANLGVVWTSPDGTPSCDGKTIYLPTLTSETTQETVDEYMHYVAHEVGHVLYSDMELVQEKNLPQDSELMMLWNIVEDHRVNYLNATNYAGDKVNDDAHYAAILPRVLERLVIIPDMEHILEVMKWETRLHGDYANLVSHIEVVLKNDNLLKYDEELRTIRTIESPTEGTTATFELAKKLYDEEHGDGEADKEEKAAQDSKEKGKGDAKGKGESGGDESAGEGEEGGDSGGESSGDAGNGGDEGKGEGRKVVVKWSELVGGSEHGKKEGKPTPYHIDYDMVEDGVYVPTEYNAIDQWKWQGTSFAPTLGKDFKHDMVSLRAYHKGVPNVGGGFANRVRSKLQIMSRARTTYAQKKGKLHGSSLHRLLCKDAHGYNERIFKNKVETSVLETSVALLVDTSGSMTHWYKYYHAMKAAALLNDVLGNILQMRIGVYGFSTYDNASGSECLSMANYREFSMPSLSTERLEEAFIKFGNATLANNSDGEAIAYVHDKLLAERNKRKILIVLSDGMPESSYERGDISAYTTKVIEDIEKKSPVELYAIGIMTRSVERFYKKWQVIDDASQLESSLMRLLDKTLLNNC